MSRSRKKRKRDRRRAEATTEGSEITGWGQGMPVGRSDIAMIRKAMREGWQIPSEVRKAILHDLKQLASDALVESDNERDSALELTIVRLVLEMEEHNQKLELVSLPPYWPTDQA